MALSGTEKTDRGYIRDADGRLVVVTTGATPLASSTPQPAATGAVYDSVIGANVTPKFKFVNVAASATDGAIVTAVAGKRLRVLAVAFVAGATATTCTFTSKGAGAGTAISCAFANAANGGAALGPSALGWFETVEGEGLSVTTGAGSTTGIQVVYVEVE